MRLTHQNCHGVDNVETDLYLLQVNDYNIHIEMYDDLYCVNIFKNKVLQLNQSTNSLKELRLIIYDYLTI